MDLRIRDVGADRIYAYLAGPDMDLARGTRAEVSSQIRQTVDIVVAPRLWAVN